MNNDTEIYQNLKLLKKMKISYHFLESRVDIETIKRIWRYSEDGDEIYEDGLKLPHEEGAVVRYLQITFDKKFARIAVDQLRDNRVILIEENFSNKVNVVLETIIFEDKHLYLCINDEGDLVLNKNKNQIFKISLQSRLVKISRKRNALNLSFIGYFLIKNNVSINIDKLKFLVGEHEIGKVDNILQFHKALSKARKILLFKKLFHKINLPLNQLVDENMLINNPIRVKGEFNGIEIEFPIKLNKRKSSSKECYIPLKSYTIKDHILLFRLTANNNLVFVKRLMEPIERIIKFAFLESSLISIILKIIGKLYRKISGKKINIYFEKYAEKAEEGTLELFKLIRDSNEGSKDYYFISEEGYRFERLENEKNIIIKYSFMYYIIFYAADNIIATEAPGHINILRSKNKVFKKSIYSKKHIFLQHGIIYMKNLKDSTFVRGRESEPDVILVSSEKEKSAVKRTMGLRDKNIAVTGIPMYDTIEYNHINQSYEDIVAIMLTWKPYEEHMLDFSQSSYYQYTKHIYEILSEFIAPEKIFIIPHPKAEKQMKDTEMKDSIYDGPISEVISKTKLLITDYSSICFNAFYQGAGVVFYQPDLAYYEKENGKLIPNEKEYIGIRTFNECELEKMLVQGICGDRIDLDYFRKDEFVENYQEINTFNDGRNIQRIMEMLKERDFI